MKRFDIAASRRRDLQPGVSDIIVCSGMRCGRVVISTQMVTVSSNQDRRPESRIRAALKKEKERPARGRVYIGRVSGLEPRNPQCCVRSNEPARVSSVSARRTSRPTAVPTAVGRPTGRRTSYLLHTPGFVLNAGGAQGSQSRPWERPRAASLWRASCTQV